MVQHRQRQSQRGNTMDRFTECDECGAELYGLKWCFDATACADRVRENDAEREEQYLIDAAERRMEMREYDEYQGRWGRTEG